MEKDILLICPLLFEVVSSHNMFLELEFVASASSTEQSVREMWEEMQKRASGYPIVADCLFIFPVIKIRIQSNKT